MRPGTGGPARPARPAPRAAASVPAASAPPASAPAGIAAEALAGLTRKRKTLPAKLFYDAEGCRLFGRITALPEYYLTRTERALLQRIAPEIAALAAPDAALVEYGASDEAKATLLLDAIPGRFAAYVPIDIAGDALAALGIRLRRTHPRLSVHPVEADFLAPFALPTAIAGRPRLGFFPGSTIGNLEPAAARRFLARARRALGPEALFLVGADLRKDPALLLPAYDDAAGVTARFNLNVLVRLNHEAGADFDLAAFAHRAVWNEAESRIEMHLVSLRAQAVRVGGTTIRFAAGETIHTENSYKNTEAAFTALAEAAGWGALRLWTDPGRLFAVHLLGVGRPGALPLDPAGALRPQTPVT
ncbi:MAG TPA: L-histidine N(alpha)-methyltransferase [Acetobacteraceae bacterium]|nr:L-histidine N(alpha)-methyltransferase [Acetobacteraceae bacterium]